MEIIIDVVNQRLKLPTNLKDYVEGSQNFVYFVFKFDSEWDNLKTFAQFGQNGKVYNVYLDENNGVYLPPEITNGTCSLSLYGTYGNVVATTNHVTLRIDKGIVIDSENLEVSTSLYNQLVTQLVDHETWFKENEEDIILSWIDF